MVIWHASIIHEIHAFQRLTSTPSTLGLSDINFMCYDKLNNSTKGKM